MIRALSAYKAIMEASAIDKPARREDKTTSGPGALALLSDGEQASGAAAADHDFVNISTSQDVFSAVDDFFNLGNSNRFDGFHNLSREDKESFVKIVAELAKAGYMGYEELKVNNKLERHEIAHQIGDQRLRGAKVYDDANRRR
ncbi:hypothetical protein Gbem_3165 [Citrifermentans bemidjiense Bem]|uniref:Uncharacterized protein n=1 Tax=Citrifermentans bemidjiense (strain ATCC BAA-1014 / DSM 16622 / JCM 12645 / Bem) TaxID=404380 RepID=B5E902_CITBB|nr:hypothetical protein [Citrifermentans bemidjiense]ACH40166.1 hypothetical protein Gbem_3165 [Citrifermentans bemidjiense Bem]